MAPRVSISILRSLRTPNTSRSFCCSQCLAHRSVARTNLRNRISTLRDIRNGRFASTSTTPRTAEDYPAAPLISPTTSINKPLDVAPQNRELYRALERLKNDAANYVGISRLGLALRSLEGRDGIVRIAALAMDGDVQRVKKLVRLLLADPLGKQEAWEAELAQGDNGDSVLIRYGEGGDAVQSSSQVRTLAIPSRTLEKHNLEILVSSLQLESALSEFGPSGRAHDAILVPGFNAQATSSGRYSHMTYPVHKTLLVGGGIGSLVDYGRFTVGTSAQDLPAEMVQLAVEAPAQSGAQAATDSKTDAVFLDTEAGEHGLASIRQTISNALAWEHGWVKAGIPPLNTWLLSGLASPDSSLKPAVQNLITSVLSDTSTSIAASTAAAELTAQSTTVPESVRRKLLEQTERWSELAHEELRTQLDDAFASKNWAKMNWYKLFWRSDDVTMLLTEIMERRWLPVAEKGAVLLAGRIEGAGLDDIVTQRNITDASAQDTVSLPRTTTPYPMHIPGVRANLSERTIPSLQALSQTLVLQTGTGAAVTTALTAMAYIGFANATLFEAGAVFAFGVVISLKRLQNKWEAAREYWQGEVREEGRVTLKETEDGIRTAIETGGIGVVDEVGVEDRRRAVDAVESVQKALEKMK